MGFFSQLISSDLTNLKHHYSNTPKIINRVLNYKNRQTYKKNRQRIALIKFTRGHFFLDYLKENFDVNVLVLFRNPFAVTESVIRTNMITCSLDTILDDRQNDLYSPKVGNTLRRGKLFIIRWALENAFLTQKLKSKELEANVIFYEDLYVNPQKALKRFMKSSGLNEEDFPVYKKASSSAKSSTFMGKKEHHLNLWKEKLTPELISFIHEIIEIFEIEIYDSEGKVNTTFMEKFDI